MQVQSTNNSMNFGTVCKIGTFSAGFGLPKQKKALTEGIYGAFKQLSKNKADDKLLMLIGPANPMKPEVDSVCLNYVNKKGGLQSTKNINVDDLKSKSACQIKNMLIKAYNNLKKSSNREDTIVTVATPNPIKKITNKVLKMEEKNSC